MEKKRGKEVGERKERREGKGRMRGDEEGVRVGEGGRKRPDIPCTPSPEAGPRVVRHT